MNSDLGPITKYLHLLTDLPKTMLSTKEPMVKLEEESDSPVPWRRLFEM